MKEKAAQAAAVRQSVLANIKCLSILGNDRRGAVLDGDVRGRELEGDDINAQAQPLVGREEFREGVLDGLPALEHATGFADVIPVGRPERGERLGVALVECLNEGFRRLSVINNQ